MPRTSGSTRPKPALGRPRNTSREDLLRAALGILDRHGEKALTMSALAAETGMGISSLYTYFSNLADLEDEIASRLFAQLPALDADAALPLRAQLLEFGMNLRQMHGLHPYLRMIAGPASAKEGAVLRKKNLLALHAAGIEMARASACIEVIHALGFSAGSELHRQRSAGRDARKLRRIMLDAMRPEITGFDHLREGSGDEHYRALLERTITAMLPELGAGGRRRAGKP